MNLNFHNFSEFIHNIQIIIHAFKLNKNNSNFEKFIKIVSLYNYLGFVSYQKLYKIIIKFKYLKKIFIIGNDP